MPETSHPKSSIHFHCRACPLQFESAPGRIEDAPELDHHPWRYFAECPDCGTEADQAAWERSLFKAWTKATGPKTAAGKAKTALNLVGHPTPEEAVRTRFNAMRHGLIARTATYFPAKPGGYPHCETCEYLHGVCRTQVACLKRTELFLVHHIAFETRDPGLLTQLQAELQAAVRAIINDLILAIVQDGVKLETPQWYYDKEGRFHLAQYTDEAGEKRLIKEVSAHPLLKTLSELIAKNGLSLSDQGMTPRVQEEQDLLEGQLTSQGEDRQSLLEVQSRQAEALESLRGMIARSQQKLRSDPVLIEHGELDEDA